MGTHLKRRRGTYNGYHDMFFFEKYEKYQYLRVEKSALSGTMLKVQNNNNNGTTAAVITLSIRTNRSVQTVQILITRFRM